MIYEWDKGKAEINRLKHGILFDIIEDMNWDTALITEDARRDYGETRLQALGYIRGRLHVCIYTRRERVRWIISLRKANDREKRRYEKDQKAR